MTQENLAKLVGLSRTSVVNIERGRQKVLSHLLVRLADALQVKISDLAIDSKGDLRIDDLVQNLPASAQQFVRSAVTRGSSKG